MEVDRRKQLFEKLVIDFLKILAEENPRIREKFGDHVKKEKLVWLFK